MMDVRYYMITTSGRSLIPANTDNEAVAYVTAYQKRYPFSVVTRIVKETREEIPMGDDT